MNQKSILLALYESGKEVNRDDAWRWGIRNFTARNSELEKSGYALARRVIKDNQGRNLINYSKTAVAVAVAA